MTSVLNGKKMVLKKYKFSDHSLKQFEQLLQRPRIDFSKVFQQVEPIIQGVKNRGDSAVIEYTSKFDGCQVDQVCQPIEVFSKPELEPSVEDAFNTAYSNIFKFHERQISNDEVVETMPGVKCQRIMRPVENVGLYVPGGTAVLPSTALMLGVPAKVAGCKTVVLATPPRKDGSISKEVLYCAYLCGVTHILRAGGAQAISALSFGTETTPKVSKIFGPGNQYVTAAKMVLQNSEAMISIDMPAGPSEVLVICDQYSDSSFVAIDLLSQAEHGPDSQVVLVAIKGTNIEDIQQQIYQIAQTLPRSEVTLKALDHSVIVEVDNIEQACQISNSYAPEHLIINTQRPQDFVPKIYNAGSIFLGQYTPESVGDYASGTNHVLPTYGYAKMYSGVSLDSFVKKITVQQLSETGLKNVGPAVAEMARVEELDAHRQAVTRRLEKIKNQ